MFRLHDVVRLKKDNTEYGIPSTSIGAIVDVLNDGEAYTVEFVDENGDTYEAALFTQFAADDLEAVTE